VRETVQGAYLMPPLGRYALALEVLDGLKCQASAGAR
jgi:homocysteine S-methyltransferase